MDLLTWFDESFPLRFALTLLHFLWQGCVVTLVVLIAGWMLRRASAGWRYLINLGAMLVMVACLPVTFALLDVSHVGRVSRPDVDGFGEPSYKTLTSDPTSRVYPLVSSTGINEANTLADGPRSEPATQAISHSLETSELNSHEPTNDNAAEPSRTLVWIVPAAPYLTAVYLLGVSVMVFRLASGLWGGVRLRRLGTPVDEESLLAMIRRQAKRIGLKTAPAIAYCEQISIPVLIGIIKPAILLPAALASGLSPDQLQALVMHELAHIRHYDLLVNLLQRLVEAVLFFHPAVWYVSRRVSMERENAADDLVVTAGWQRVRYADALVRMAELSSSVRNRRVAVRAAALAASGKNNTEFKRRILRLLDDDNRAKLCLTPVTTVMLVAVAAFAVLAPLLVQAWAHSQGNNAEEPHDNPASKATQEHSSHSATIVDPAGRPIGGAHVEFVAIETQTVLPTYGHHLVELAKQAAITDREGAASVSLPVARGWGGYLGIRASAPGMIRHHRRYGEPIEDSRVVLWPAKPVVGRVVDWRGKPVAGAIVYGHCLLPQTKDAENPRHRKWKDFTKTKGTGHFILTRPADMEVSLRVCSYAGVPLHASVDADTDALGDLRLSPGTLVTGIVVDEDGRPAAGIVVKLTGADTEVEAAASDAAVLTDEYGHFCLPPRRGQLILSLGDSATPWLSPEIATIRTARHIHHVPELLSLSGRDGEIARTIHAAPAVTIQGQITDSDGKPIPGRVRSQRGWYCREVFASWGGNDAGNRSVWLDRCRVDDEGRYELKVAANEDAIRLWAWVAGYPGHDMTAVPVADKDDPMIEFHERGVNLHNLNRDIELKWRLAPSGQRGKVGSRGSQTAEVFSRYVPASPHLKARLDDVAELLDLPEGTDPTSVPFESSRPAPHILGAADVKMSKVPTGYELLVLALGDQGACKSARPGDRVAVVQPFKGDEDRHFALVADATVVALSVPYSYHRINETTATVFEHPADPKAALVSVGTVTTEMSEDESPVFRTVTLLLPKSVPPRWDASLQMREDLGQPRLAKYRTRPASYDFRDSKAYAELEDEQRIKLETADRDLAVLEAALTRYIKDHGGSPPMTLGALVPRYIAELLKDPFATEKTAADKDLGQYKPSLDGWGYRYQRRDKRAYPVSSDWPPKLGFLDGGWEVHSVGLPNFRYRSSNSRGLYKSGGYWGRFTPDFF